MRVDGACWGDGERGKHRQGQIPHSHPSTPNKNMEEEGIGREGRRGPVGEGKGEPGEEQKIQEQVGGNPVQSKANQNFKPYLRCLTSGEPDLGKGKERKKGEKKEEKERKGERNKENTSHQNQPERGEKKVFAATI